MAGTGSNHDRDWVEDLEESAQGTTVFSAPGSAGFLEDARDDASEAEVGWPDNMGLQTASAVRASLAEEMGKLEVRLGAPHASEGWGAAIAKAVTGLNQAFDEHRSVTEGPDGLLFDIIRDAPRLERKTQGIVAEHRDLERLIGKLETDSSVLTSAGPVDPQRVRRRALVVLGRLAAHRQRGADLVYEAYHVDIAAGG